MADPDVWIVEQWHGCPCDQARREGWGIFDCDGSEYGRWQVCKVDEADEGDAQLDMDDAAWKILIEGDEPHHHLARQFIRDHNPKEWAFWCSNVPNIKVDMKKVKPSLIPEIVAAVLA